MLSCIIRAPTRTHLFTHRAASERMLRCMCAPPTREHSQPTLDNQQQRQRGAHQAHRQQQQHFDSMTSSAVSETCWFAACSSVGSSISSTTSSSSGSSDSSSSLTDGDLEMLVGSSSPASVVSCFRYNCPTCAARAAPAAGDAAGGLQAAGSSSMAAQAPSTAAAAGSAGDSSSSSRFCGCCSNKHSGSGGGSAGQHSGRQLPQHQQLGQPLPAAAGTSSGLQIQQHRQLQTQPARKSQLLQQNVQLTTPDREKPLLRTWSWPWGFSSSGGGGGSDGGGSVSGASISGASSMSSTSGGSVTTPDAAVVVPLARRTNSSSSVRRMRLESGLASVAGAAALHPAVQAYLHGSLGIAFSGGGFRYTYFIGVMDVLLHHLGLVGPRCLLSGASSGALIAVFTKCGLPVEKVLQLTDEFSHDCAAKGVKGRLGTVLRAYLNRYLPQDAHTLCHGNTYLAVTKVWPSIRTRLFSSFPKRSDLIAAVLASCHLPTLSDGSLTVNFHGNLHIDGGLLSVITPPPHASHSVLVCSMPSGQIARLPAFISRPCQADISISPDTFQSWPFSRKETTDLALQPPNADFIQHMVERGRTDALAWAEAVGFTRNGQPVWPRAARLEQLRQQAFGPAVAATTASLPGTSPILDGHRAQWELFVSRAAQEGRVSNRPQLLNNVVPLTPALGLRAAAGLQPKLTAADVLPGTAGGGSGAGTAAAAVAAAAAAATAASAAAAYF